MKDIVLTNTSPVPMEYNFRILEGYPFSREFFIEPEEGELGPGGRQNVTLTFVPTTVQKYNLHLVMDIPDVVPNAAKVRLAAWWLQPVALAEAQRRHLSRQPRIAIKLASQPLDFHICSCIKAVA